MTLSADALEVLTFLKSCPGQFVSMRSISLRAGGRRKYEETPGWAKGLMAPLVEGDLIEMNERGHYRVKGCEGPKTTPAKHAPSATKKSQGKIVGDDYFPASGSVVGDNYFPRSG